MSSRKRLVVSFEGLKEVFHLPGSVEVMAVRQTDQGTLEATISDPLDEMPDDVVFDRNTGTWVPSPLKGSVCGAEDEG